MESELRKDMACRPHPKHAGREAFRSPQFVLVDATGNVAVAETGNHREQISTASTAVALTATAPATRNHAPCTLHPAPHTRACACPAATPHGDDLLKRKLFRDGRYVCAYSASWSHTGSRAVVNGPGMWPRADVTGRDHSRLCHCTLHTAHTLASRWTSSIGCGTISQE